MAILRGRGRLFGVDHAMYDCYSIALDHERDLNKKTRRDLHEADRLRVSGEIDQAWYEARCQAINDYHAMRMAQIEAALNATLEALK